MTVFRPADGKETAAAWYTAMTHQGPTCLVLTRQNLPCYEETGKQALKMCIRDSARIGLRNRGVIGRCKHAKGRFKRPVCWGGGR